MTTANSAPQQSSFLVADCGSTNTNVVLFDVVDGVYRFIGQADAPTTANAPWSDLIKGVQHAITRVSDATGRPLLDDQGLLITPAQSNGSGVDHFATTISAAAPLKCILVGLLDDVSLQSARHALNNIYAYEVDCLNLADKRTMQEQIRAITNHKPDLILISGGTDGGATAQVMKLVETVALAINMLSGVARPHIIYAGNVQLREQVTELLGNISTLHVADNVRPSLEVERLDAVADGVGEIYRSIKIGAVPGSAEVAQWSSLPLAPTAKAFATIVEYFAALYEGGVLGIDLGSDNVTLVAAEPDNVRLIVRSDLGLGRPVTNLLKYGGPEAIARWLPGPVDPDELTDAIFDKSLHPQTVPTSDYALHLEQSLAREILRQVTTAAPAHWRGSAMSRLPSFRLLLARGSVLANTPRPGQTVLMLLDALQPTGIFSIALDRHGVLSSLGALAGEHPLLVVQALEGGVLVDLGWVIAPTGRAQRGQKILTVHMETETIGKLDVEVTQGTLEVLPLAPGQMAELTLKPVRNIDIGYGPGQGKKVRVQGGTVGLIIDARGRPLNLPKDDDERYEILNKWLWDVGG